jgi:uncharacterized protein YgiM (DUF1202 family)
MYRRYFVTIAILTLLMAVAPGRSFTQGDGGTCPELVKKALADVGNNCGDLSRNNACYGYNRLDATFSESVAEDFFSKPKDRTPLKTVQSINTAALDTELNQWGVAVMAVQADIPNTLPGQAVRFILFGDAKIENAVKAENIVQPVETPIEVTAVTRANIRSFPTVNSNVVGNVAAGTKLPGDALSADKKWVRVVVDKSTPGWISLDVARTNDDLTKLPVIVRESKTPMQAFYFTTNIGAPKCNEAPSLLVVQGPQKVAVNISANGADIRIGSTIVLKKNGANTMQIIVINGNAKIGNVIIPRGFTVEAPLSDDGKTITGPLTNLRPLTQEELDGLAVLEDLPLDLLNYKIELPTEAEIQQLLAALRGGGNGGNQGNNTGPASGQADCSKFKLTSPLDAWATTNTTFYWDPAPGATSYRITTSQGQTAETSSTNTAFSLGGGGDNFSWTVEALVNGQVACSATVNLTVRDHSIRPGPAQTPGP